MQSALPACRSARSAARSSSSRRSAGARTGGATPGAASFVKDFAEGEDSAAEADSSGSNHPSPHPAKPRHRPALEGAEVVVADREQVRLDLSCRLEEDDRRVPVAASDLDDEVGIDPKRRPVEHLPLAERQVLRCPDETPKNGEAGALKDPPTLTSSTTGARPRFSASRRSAGGRTAHRQRADSDGGRR